MNVPNMNDCRAFVAGILLASTEGRDPMTVEDAAVSLREWQAEGMDDIPDGLTPELISSLWNEMLDGKTYRIKPEFIDLFGPDATAETVFTENMLSDMARWFETTVDELKEQLYLNTPVNVRWYLSPRYEQIMNRNDS